MTRWILTMALLVSLRCNVVLAAPGQVRLPWEQLQARIIHKKVALVLPDGTHIQGKVLGVLPEGLRMNVSKSSNRRVQPKGKQLIPRDAISVLHVTEYGRLWRLVGVLSAAGIVGGIVAAQDIDLYEGPMVVAVPVIVGVGGAGAAVGGYFTGKHFDRRVTEILVVP